MRTIPLLHRSTKHTRQRQGHKRQAKDVFYVMLCKQCKTLGLPEPQTEYRFYPDRKWRFDYAWPDAKATTVYAEGECEECCKPVEVSHVPMSPLAIEIQGGTFIRGRHSRGAGQHTDYEKLNEAQRLGWRILQFDSVMISSQPKRQKCVDLVLEMLQ